MLATLASDLPVGPEWVYEVKLDGWRALATIKGGRLVALHSRRGREMQRDFPNLRVLPATLRRTSVVLDGELVGPRVAGRPGMGHVARGDCTFVAFDVLAMGGRLLLDQPWHQRRAVLEALPFGEKDSAWYKSEAFEDGTALLAETRRRGLEGVVAKRRDSRYEAG